MSATYAIGLRDQPDAATSNSHAASMYHYHIAFHPFVARNKIVTINRYRYDRYGIGLLLTFHKAAQDAFLFFNPVAHLLQHVIGLFIGICLPYARFAH